MSIIDNVVYTGRRVVLRLKLLNQTFREERLSYCPNTGGAVMPEPRCKHYRPKETGYKEGCANCHKGIGIQCLNHLTMAKEYQTSRKFAELDRMMRTYKGARIG